MNKKLGKNEASHILTKNMVKMTVSIMAIILFIGTTIQPAIAGSVSSRGIISEPNEEECTLCATASEKPPEFPGCKTCVEAIYFAVNYSKDYVKEQINKTKNDPYYLYKGLEVVIHIKNGIKEGIKESGFKFKKLDEKGLTNYISYVVNKTVGPQQINSTRFLAYLTAIVIGITGYLLSLCNNDQTKGRVPTTPLMWFITQLKSMLSRWINAFHMIRP